MSKNLGYLGFGLMACGLALASGPAAAAGPSPEAAPAPADQSAANAPYRLGAQDVISVKVFEWRPSIDQIYAWEALNAKYTIGPAGQLALPLVGELPVTGLTTQELARQISNQLRERMGLAAAPDATVEIVEYRPFYLFGLVEKPGQYPFQPGMTVLRAISVGGGLSRARDSAAMRLQRESISSRGELEVLLTELDALIARSARLEAELAGQKEIAFPLALIEQKDQAQTLKVVELEKLIFEARNQAFATQMTALKQLRGYLEQEVQSLKSQRNVHNTQQKLVTEELDKVRSLASKGLTTGTRQLELERVAAQLEGDGLRLDGSLIRTRQDISRTDISILELENRRKGDLTVDLRETKKVLEQVQTKRNVAAKLVYESEVVAPTLLMDDETGVGAQMVYKIVRAVSGKMIELPVSENTPVLPGDIVKIESAKVKRRGADIGSASEAMALHSGLSAAKPPKEFAQ